MLFCASIYYTIVDPRLDRDVSLTGVVDRLATINIDVEPNQKDNSDRSQDITKQSSTPTAIDGNSFQEPPELSSPSDPHEAEAPPELEKVSDSSELRGCLPC